MKRNGLWILPLALIAALAGCSRQSGGESGQGGGQEGQGGGGSSEVAGYYVYSDPARGSYSLALLDNNRFLMVSEAADSSPGGTPTPRGADEAPGGAAADAGEALADVPQGVVGWYVMRGDRIHLSSEAGMDAEGVVKGEIIRLQFGGGLPETYTPDEDFGLPFQKWQQQPEESQQGGSGSGGKEGGGSGGSSGGEEESGGSGGG